MKTHDLTQTQCTISSIIEVVKQTFGNDTDFWFRGQANYEHKLLPSIFRQGEAFGGKAMDEAAMIRQFKQQHPGQRHHHTDDNEWLSLMQHYGLPTRILDWSTNILVGIYFAIDQLNDVANDGVDGALYVFNPERLNNPVLDMMDLPYDDLAELSTYRTVLAYLIEVICRDVWLDLDPKDMYQIRFFTSEETILTSGFTTSMYMTNAGFALPTGTITPRRITGVRMVGLEHKPGHVLTFNAIANSKLTALIRPRPLNLAHLNDRIKAQHGVFTWHGGKYIDGIEVLPYIAPEEMWDDDLLKIKIPIESKQKLLDELAYAGITKASLFPDMEHQAQSIRDKYTTWPNL